MYKYKIMLRTKIEWSCAIELTDPCKRAQFEAQVWPALVIELKRQTDKHIAYAIERAKARYQLGVALLMETLEKYEKGMK